MKTINLSNMTKAELTTTIEEAVNPSADELLTHMSNFMDSAYLRDFTEFILDENSIPCTTLDILEEDEEDEELEEEDE